jgi:hypothetical protein
VGPTRGGLTQEEDRKHGVEQPHVFHRVALVLAAIIARLRSRILRTPDTPVGAIMPTRGEAGACAGAAGGGLDALGGSGTDPTSALASASVTPRRFASSVKDRVGASPSARSVACRTTHRTCIHGWALRWPMPNSRPCTTGRGEVLGSTRINSSRSSGVGNGQFLSVVYRRRCAVVHRDGRRP